MEDIPVVAVGDAVRSYDFEHREDCYVEGTIVEILPVRGKYTWFETEADADAGEPAQRNFTAWDCDRYVIRSERRVVQGEERVFPTTYFFPPVNGTPGLLFGTQRGVVKIT